MAVVHVCLGGMHGKYGDYIWCRKILWSTTSAGAWPGQGG